MAATASDLRRPFETTHRAHQRSNSRRNSAEANVGIPFHGSCSRCHHFHINHPFTFSLDSTVHTRLLCERCNHPMFGLGRASTQNTLASVESGSTFAPRTCVDRPGERPTLQVEALPGTSGLGVLSTITERKSPAPSRSTSNIRTPTATLAAAFVAGEETAGVDVQGERPVKSRALANSTAQESPEEQALHPQIATLNRLRKIGRRFKQRFYVKPRGWKMPRIRVQISHTRKADMPDHMSASVSPAEGSSGHERSDNAEEIGNGRANDTEDRHALLRARRREITLARKEAASIAKCDCSRECPCISGSHIVQVDRTETPENIHVPDYLFPHHHSSTGSSNSQQSQSLDLLHIGGHFDSPRRSSSADESSSAAESGQRRIRLSQDSTLWSNGSSISLRVRRPLVSRASSMPVGTRAQYIAGFRTGSRNNSSIPGSGLSETARASSSLDGGDRHGPISHTEFDGNGGGSPHQSSTSLANPSDPQGEERRIDGVSPASRTPMRNGDEMTPTPHSGIRLDGVQNGVLTVGSDGLSNALQDLANGATTDHEVPSPELPGNDRSQ